MFFCNVSKPGLQSRWMNKEDFTLYNALEILGSECKPRTEVRGCCRVAMRRGI